jgi:hypothetical protein
MRVVKDRVTKMWDDSAAVDNQLCLAAWSPAQEKAYAGAQWGVVRGQILKDGIPGQNADHSVEQTVVQFSKSDAARDFFATSTKSWSACEGQTIVSTGPDGRRQSWSLENFTATDDTLTITQTLPRSTGGCQRALSVRANVSIDVMVCGADVTNEAASVVSAIADGMPTV